MWSHVISLCSPTYSKLIYPNLLVVLDVIVKCDEGKGWMSAAGRCYKFYDTPSTWQDAQNYCEAVDGHLISVMSEEEQTVVSTQANFGGSTIWIGLRMNVSQEQCLKMQRQIQDLFKGGGGHICKFLTSKQKEK